MSEVIIDGCNVAECEYNYGLYKGVKGCINLSLNPACCKNPDCYFKQLQRVKAENEKIKEANQAWGLTVIRLREELEELKVENKSLKEEIEEKQQTLEACEAEYRRVVSKLNESRGNLTKLP